MLFAVLAGFIFAFLTPLIARATKEKTGYLLALLPFAIFSYLCTFISPVIQGETFRFFYPWLPGQGINLDFFVDGLSLFFALLISGFGVLIFIYSGSYMKNYRHRDKFFVYLLLFMGSMLGLVLSENLISLIVFWELTSFSSYLLIGFNNDNAASRQSALHAMLITVFGGLFLLAGMILLGSASGTYSLVEILSNGRSIQDHKNYIMIFILFCLGAFTKSAQFPFHFWLPNAMAAPTPVSAYLHSSTMVKAGIYLLARFNPALGGSEIWHTTLITVGFITMLWGAVVAMLQSDLKKILAYTTISALGILVLMLGLGTPQAVQAAMVFLLAHALYKGTLFLMTGNVDKATGTRDITFLKGLRKNMPFTAVAAILACLSMSGVMPFIGFVGKEMLYTAAFESEILSNLLLAGVMVSGLIFVAICIDIGYTMFFGLSAESLETTEEVPVGMLAGPLVLSMLGLVFGFLAPSLVQPLLSWSSLAVLPGMELMELHLWHGFNQIFMLSLLTLLLGFGLYKLRKPVRNLASDKVYALKVNGAVMFQNLLEAKFFLFKAFIKFLQNGKLKNYLLIILIFFTLIIIYTLWRFDLTLDFSQSFTFFHYKIYEIINLLIILFALGMVFYTKSRLTALVTLGVVGYGIALIFIIYSAPDVAMTQFLIETLTVVLFVLVLHKLPDFQVYTNRKNRIPHIIVSVLFGGLMTYILLLVTQSPLESKLKEYFVENSYLLGKGKNIVNVILVDFRALDTLGEITVLGIAALGIYALLKLRLNNGGVK